MRWCGLGHCLFLRIGNTYKAFFVATSVGWTIFLVGCSENLFSFPFIANDQINWHLTVTPLFLPWTTSVPASGHNVGPDLANVFLYFWGRFLIPDISSAIIIFKLSNSSELWGSRGAGHMHFLIAPYWSCAAPKTDIHINCILAQFILMAIKGHDGRIIRGVVALHAFSLFFFFFASVVFFDRF